MLRTLLLLVILLLTGCAAPVEAPQLAFPPTPTPVPEALLAIQAGELAFTDEELSTLPAHIPPEQDEASGVYPHWYGGYYGMEGSLVGVFCIGEDEQGYRYFGQVFRDETGKETVVGMRDNPFRGTPRLAARVGESTDLHFETTLDTATGVTWPSFERRALINGWVEKEDVSQEYLPYYETTYRSRLRVEIAAHEAERPNRISALAIPQLRGLLAATEQWLAGEITILREVKEVIWQPECQPIGSLAGIYPGDTIEDAKALHDLSPITPEEMQLRYNGLSFGSFYQGYWDGRGLIILAHADGRIAAVHVLAPGYENPFGEQVGDPGGPAAEEVRCRDSIYTVAYTEVQSAKHEEEKEILDISLTMILDRLWDETELDIDGDGKKERITLSGRATRSRVERPTERGTLAYVDPSDPGTRTRIRIYQGDALLAEEELQIYIDDYAPRPPEFADRHQRRHGQPGDIMILSRTGGTGSEEPTYRVRYEGGMFTMEYLGEQRP